MERPTLQQLEAMLERGELSASVAHRRQTLLAISNLAKHSKGHTPASRRRLKAFHAMLDSERNNDEIEVTGEIFCEIVILAMEADQ